MEKAGERASSGHVLFDIRRSTEDRPADELAGIASFVAGHLGVLSGRCAVLAGRDFHYGLGRVFEAHAEGHDLRVAVFRDETAARGFLASEGG